MYITIYHYSKTYVNTTAYDYDFQIDRKATNPQTSKWHSESSCPEAMSPHQATPNHDFQGATWISRWKNSWTGMAMDLQWFWGRTETIAFSRVAKYENHSGIQFLPHRSFQHTVSTSLGCPEPNPPLSGSLKIMRHGLSFSRWHCAVSWLGFVG